MAELSPECHTALKAAHERLGSLAKVGRALTSPGKPAGYTASAVHTLLKGTYGAKDLTPIEAAIRANLMKEWVACPELGEMALGDCQEHHHHARGGNRTSTFRVRMARACMGCEHGGV